MKPVSILVLATLLSGAAIAQEAPSSSEYGRASGGEIRAVTKDLDGRFSGTLGFTTSTGFLGGGNRQGYSASAGGTIVEDRAWFFASAESLSSRFGGINTNGLNANALDAKITTQLGDRNSLNAAYSTAPVMTTTPTVALPSSFLSLHYTGIVSSNMFFTTSITRRKTSGSGWAGDFSPQELH